MYVRVFSSFLPFILLLFCCCAAAAAAASGWNTFHGWWAIDRWCCSTALLWLFVGCVGIDVGFSSSRGPCKTALLAASAHPPARSRDEEWKQTFMKIKHIRWTAYIYILQSGTWVGEKHTVLLSYTLYLQQYFLGTAAVPGILLRVHYTTPAFAVSYEMIWSDTPVAQPHRTFW